MQLVDGWFSHGVGGRWSPTTPTWSHMDILGQRYDLIVLNLTYEFGKSTWFKSALFFLWGDAAPSVTPCDEPRTSSLRERHRVLAIKLNLSEKLNHYLLPFGIVHVTSTRYVCQICTSVSTARFSHYILRIADSNDSQWRNLRWKVGTTTGLYKLLCYERKLYIDGTYKEE